MFSDIAECLSAYQVRVHLSVESSVSIYVQPADFFFYLEGGGGGGEEEAKHAPVN